MTSLKYTPYSFSKISTFNACKKKFKLSYVDGIWLKSDNIALEKGNYIHLILENVGIILKNLPFLLDDKKELLKILKEVIIKTSFNFRLSKDFHIRKYHEILANFLFSEIGLRYFLDVEILSNEAKFGIEIVNNKIKSCGYVKRALIRGKIDYIVIYNNEIHIFDFKTGKVREPDELQMKLYALWYFLEHPEVNIIKSAFLYVEHNEVSSRTYSRDDLPLLVKELTSNIKGPEAELIFKMKESPLCNFCSYRTNINPITNKIYCSPKIGNPFA